MTHLKKRWNFDIIDPNRRWMMLNALTLDQLLVLVTIEDTGSFSAAGRKLRRAQSAISHAVQSLENVHQVQLFDRSAKVPKMTDAGRVLATQARQVLRQAEQFSRMAGAISAGLEPELGIAVDSMVPTAPVLNSLSRLQKTFPDLAVTIFTEGLWSAERRVRDGTAAIALCALKPNMSQELRAYPLSSVALVPVVSPAHPLAQAKPPVDRQVLAEHVQLILTDPLQQGGPSFSVVSPRVWRFVDIGRRLEFLLGGFGWCNMPYHLVVDHLAQGRLVRLEIEDTGVLPGLLPLFTMHRRDMPLGKAARWLLADLQEQEWPKAHP
ncbi:DNA-binding transcriptional LysR family regulator [Rhizobium aquaticum]|uniref:DNA-binding transcriptional LysR family regulator n=1 Tax=Rhizobium aquaticum TaxID=1549636 RepID=A0ABV2J5B9_9HYPH